LTINSTGAGNSGGPVIDTNGRVVAIFTLGIQRDVQISGAVPIRYGMELMSVKPMEAR
jgi:S1-C subfamily serine protease